MDPQTGLDCTALRCFMWSSFEVFHVDSFEVFHVDNFEVLHVDSFEVLRVDSFEQLLNRIMRAVMDSVEMESVQIKEEFPELEPLPFRVEFFGLASLLIKQELCEMQCDSSQPEVSEIKAEHNELEIPQTEEHLPVKQEYQV
ncbi:UNVERIFIED_CONTAM: hypothetical protein FKN15_022098 [Acipenser sinensis]